MLLLPGGRRGGSADPSGVVWHAAWPTGRPRVTGRKGNAVATAGPGLR